MNRNWLMFHTIAPEVAIEDLKEIYRQRNGCDEIQSLASKVEKAIKLKDAQNTIDKIDLLLADSSLFRHQVDSLYDKISRNKDYAPFIEAAKISSKMKGNIPFEQLSYVPKRKALIMIRGAIGAYIAAEKLKKEN